MYLFSRIGHLKKIMLKGRGFRCGSDEKMMRMWFGIEIDVVGLPPLGQKFNRGDVAYRRCNTTHRNSNLFYWDVSSLLVDIKSTQSSHVLMFPNKSSIPLYSMFPNNSTRSDPFTLVNFLRINHLPVSTYTQIRYILQF